MRVIGMISGTSHDGIDVAAVDFSFDAGVLTGVVLDASSVAYSPQLRDRLIAALPPQDTTLAEVCELDTLIGQEFAAAAAQLCAGIGNIDAICSHGQTVYHWVDGPRALGTLQIGQPAWIAERVGCPVVSDIRIRDLTVGGQGAPLASTIDYLLLRGREGVPAALNLGGISNMSVLAPAGLLAFDIGPSNALLDAVVVTRALNPAGYDLDAAIGRQGVVNEALLAQLMSDPYYAIPAPKSTGKEYFHAVYVAEQLARFGQEITDADLLATLAELTVQTVVAAAREQGVTYLGVSGGGVRNPLILDGLRRALPEVTIELTDQLGAPADSKEAILMALIGWCTLHGVPGVIPGGTGANEPRILGTITPGRGPLVLPAPVAGVDSLRLVVRG